MNLRQIEVFHAVYSSGSISAASRLLNVSQPSVSKIVKHAEARLGFPLFRLVRGRLVATEEAHVLFRDVAELYERIGTFQQTARNLRSHAEGRIRIGLLPSLALSVGPEAIAQFRPVAPRASFEVSIVHHDDFRATLAARECDLVVGHHLLQGPEVQSIALGTGRVGALFRRSLFARVPDRIDGATLRGQDIIRLAPSVAIADLVEPIVPVLGTGGQRTVEVRTVYIAAALARQGVGVAIVDEFTARGLLTPDLCFRPIEPAVTFGLTALHLAEQPVSRLARSFLDVMRQVIAGPPVASNDGIEESGAPSAAAHATR